MSKPGGYSSQSDTPSGNKHKSYPNVATNKDLLEPNKPKVDPKDQSAKSQEKDQMVGLNDKFIAFIDKVCYFIILLLLLLLLIGLIILHNQYIDAIGLSEVCW